MALTHEIRGLGCKLRPVCEEDADLILDLRSDQEYSSYLPSLDNTLNEQMEWIEDQRKRENDYYFVVENTFNNKFEGLISLYNNTGEISEFEWGRWIMRPGSLLAVESAYLLHEFAFGELKLDLLYCNTVVDNEKVVNFHDNFGATKIAENQNYFKIKGRFYNGIRHEMTNVAWDSVKKRNETIVRRYAELMRRNK